MNEPAAIDIRRAAMDMLARREHSRAELRQKLQRRFSSLDVTELDAELQRLADQGLQSDRRFTESFVRSKMASGKGPLAIRAQLSQKGVDAGCADTLFDDGDECWQEQAAQVYRKRFGDTAPQDQRERARRLRFMASRGFSARHLQHLPLLD